MSTGSGGEQGLKAVMARSRLAQAAASTSAPTREIGGIAGQGLLPWSAFIDDQERVPELTWPMSVQAYHIMRTDAQIAGLMFGMTAPIRRYRWRIDPNGARDEIVAAISEDVNLPILGADDEPKRRSKRRFSFDEHIRHAFLSLIYGHMFFEQVGEIVDGKWRLRKLAPRMPHTIAEINVASDGGLLSIKQNLFNAGVVPEIPVDRLVAYSWDREGGGWIGRSMLREMYKHWLMKDRLMRVDTISHETRGMGQAVAYGAQGMSAAQIDKLAEMAASVKVGESAGMGLPFGTDIKFKGVEGQVPDTLASIRYHDEMMARKVMMMFVQLGQTETGSRALGETFSQYLGTGQQAVATFAQTVFNEHVIEDWVDWNYGENEDPVPLLVYEVPDDDPNLSITDLVALVEKGAITVDPELEDYLRGLHNLPEKPEQAPEPPPDPLVEPPTKILPMMLPTTARRTSRVSASGEAYSLPSKIRRQPYEQEVMAKTDFAGIEATMNSAIDQVMADWGAVQAAQFDALQTAIAATSDVAKLSQVEAPTLGADVLAARMQLVLDAGAQHAISEAARQGREIPKPSLTKASARVEARAQATANLLSRSIAETAGRRAVALSGGSLESKEVADLVRSYLGSLSDSYLKDQLGGAITQAMNTGRREVMRGEEATIFSSELMDDATCDNCTAVDGTQYGSIEESESDYPTGGFWDCLGGPRCRGTLIAVYSESEATS